MIADDFHSMGLNSTDSLRSFLNTQVPEIYRLATLDRLADLELAAFGIADALPDPESRSRVYIQYSANLRSTSEPIDLLSYLQQHYGGVLALLTSSRIYKDNIKLITLTYCVPENCHQSI